jgi:hypothetical protein
VSTGSTGGAVNVTAAVAKPAAGQRAETGLSKQTRLEMAAGRRAAERGALQTAVPSALKRTNGTANGTPFSLDEPVDTGLLEAAANQPTDLAKDIQHEVPVLDFPPPVNECVSTETAALNFLEDFFGTGKRHLVAIKKCKGKKPDIKARHFDAADLSGQEQFITDHGNAGYDLYFSPNQIEGPLHKKATKNDVVEAAYLWIDLDPRVDEPLEAERAAMLALLTTNLPEGVPRPNRVIDSGRGFWGYWKLDKPAPVDGAQYKDGRIVCNNPLTDIVESTGAV